MNMIETCTPMLLSVLAIEMMPAPVMTSVTHIDDTPTPVLLAVELSMCERVLNGQ